MNDRNKDCKETEMNIKDREMLIRKVAEDILAENEEAFTELAK